VKKPKAPKPVIIYHIIAPLPTTDSYSRVGWGQWFSVIPVGTGPLIMPDFTREFLISTEI
jgi:hypothetical protein